MSRTLATVTVTALMLTGTPCFSQPEDSSLRKAKQLFEKGETQYRLGDFRKALTSYQRALKQARRSSIIFNIAQCHRQLKRWKKALFYYNLYLADWERQNPTKPPPYYAEVKGHIREAKQQIRKAKRKRTSNLEDWGALTGLLRLDGLPNGARIYVNGALRGKAPMDHPMELKTGKHRVTVEHAGAEPWGKTVSITSGELTRVPVSMALAQQEHDTLWLGLGIASAVVALGAEITALVFTSKANDVLSSSSDFETYKGAAIAGHVTMGVFAAASVASFVAYYFSGQSKKDAPTTSLLPTPGGLVFTWQF